MRVKPLCTLFSRHQHYSVHYPLGKRWNTSILQSSREVHTAEQRPRRPSRHSCHESVRGRHCRALTCGGKAEELHQLQQKSQHWGPDVTKGVGQTLTAMSVNSTIPCTAPPLAILSRARLHSFIKNNFLKIWIFMGITSFQSLTQILNLQWVWGSQIKIFHSLTACIKLWPETIKRRPRAPHIKSWHTCQSTVTLQGRYSANKTIQTLTWWATERATHACW